MRILSPDSALRIKIGTSLDAAVIAGLNRTVPADDAYRRLIDRWVEPPLISVLMPVYEPPRRWLTVAVQSVFDQVYPHWELCVADDASPSGWVADYLAEVAASDSRVKTVVRAKNGHISAASNSALALATGDLVALLDNDDELSPFALLALALAWSTPSIRPTVIHSDEDKIDEYGVGSEPYRKTEWNPDLAVAHNYVSHLGAYSRTAVTAVGGFREGYEGSQDWDLMLRCVERPGATVAHVPYVHYRWRTLPTSTASGEGVKSYAQVAALKAIAEHSARLGSPATATVIPGKGFRLVPTDDATFDSVHVVRVPRNANGEQLDRLVRSIEDPSAIAVLLAEDAELPTTPGWQRIIAFHLGRQGVGAVGGRVVDQLGSLIDGALLARPGTFSAPAVAVAFVGLKAGQRGPNAREHLTHSVTALSSSFLAIRIDVFQRVGGFDPALRHYADVDLCRRLAAQGLRGTWLPELAVTSARPRARPPGPEARAVAARWPELRERDPNAPAALGRLPQLRRAPRWRDPVGRRAIYGQLKQLIARQEASSPGALPSV